MSHALLGRLTAWVRGTWTAGAARRRTRRAVARALRDLARAWPTDATGVRIQADGTIQDPLSAHRRLAITEDLAAPLAALRAALPGRSDHVLLVDDGTRLHLFAAQDAGLSGDDVADAALHLAGYVHLSQRAAGPPPGTPPIPERARHGSVRQVRLPKPRRRP